MSVMKNKETISDSKDCEKIKVTLALMTELEKGEDSAREEGWISADEVEKTLRKKKKLYCNGRDESIVAHLFCSIWIKEKQNDSRKNRRDQTGVSEKSRKYQGRNQT